MVGVPGSVRAKASALDPVTDRAWDSLRSVIPAPRFRPHHPSSGLPSSDPSWSSVHRGWSLDPGWLPFRRCWILRSSLSRRVPVRPWARSFRRGEPRHRSEFRATPFPDSGPSWPGPPPRVGRTSGWRGRPLGQPPQTGCWPPGFHRRQPLGRYSSRPARLRRVGQDVLRTLRNRST